MTKAEAIVFLNICRKWFKPYTSVPKQWDEALDTAIDALREPKPGEWVPVTNGRGGHECSECHSYAPSYQTGKEHLTDFCPSCGLKMKSRKEVFCYECPHWDLGELDGETVGWCTYVNKCKPSETKACDIGKYARGY